MNAVLNYLNHNWQRFELGAYGNPADLSCAVITPRFQTSRHVVFLFFSKQTASPILVAKVPRLPGDDAAISREAHNIRAAHNTRPGGFDTIPQLITLDDSRTYPILLESALPGRLLNPAMIRRNRKRYVTKVTEWLIDFHQSSRTSSNEDPEWFERLISNPLRKLERIASDGDEMHELLQQTREIAEPLKQSHLPLVFEHGDLSDPNLILMKNGKIGVLDWECAEPLGLPICDLLFFLNYAGSSSSSPKASPRQIFHETFLDNGSWAQKFIQDYTQQLALPLEALQPLSVLCWARQVASLVERTNGENREQSEDTIQWLLEHRYYALWKYSINLVERLYW